MKRIISFITVIVLLISTVPVMSVEAVSVNAVDAYFKVNDSYYNTLSGAIDALTEGTITLQKDATIDECKLVLTNDKFITLDLNGYTLTASSTTEYLFDEIRGGLIVQNGNVNVARGFVIQGGGHLMVYDADMTVTYTGADARPLVKLSGEGSTKLTVRDSHLKTVGPGESLILIEQGTYGSVIISGETVLEYAGVIDAEPQNCGAIVVQQAWGSGVNSSDESSNTDAVISIGSGSKVLTTAPAIDKAYVASTIALSTNGDVMINLEKGAILAIDRIAGNSRSTHINCVNYTPKSIKVQDRGALWSVSASALRGGNIYFTDIASSGSQVVGWDDGTKLIKAQTPYKVIDATEDVSYSPITISSNDFYMLDGAALRTVDGVKALRFSTVVLNALVEKLGVRASYGTLIAPGKINPQKSSEDKLKIPASRVEKYRTGSSMYHAGVNIPTHNTEKNSYEYSVSALAYVTVSYYDGSTRTFYTDFDDNNVRDMRTVATNLEKKGVDNDIIRHIVDLFADDESGVYWKKPVLVSYCTAGSLYDGEFNSSVGWFAAGMGYIVRTETGKIIVVDGGNSDDAIEFYMLLKEYCLTENVVVDYWIFTHPHGDHVNCFISMCQNSEIMDNLVVKNLVYYFPSDYKDSSCGAYKNTIEGYAREFGANVITPSKGLVIDVDGTKIDFLYVPTGYASFTSGNQLSLIFSIQANKKIMFTGDSFVDGLTTVTNEYGSALKSDILQMPHHFLCDTGYKPFYEAVNASEVVLPTCIAGYNAMYNDASYKNSTKHKANDFAAQNADKVYKAFDGTVAIEI